MTSILSDSHLVLKPMVFLRAENKKANVGDLVRIKYSVFDLIENQLGVITEIEGNTAIINMIGHYKPITIPDVRDWLDVIEIFDSE